ncbi:MAG TPA: type IV pilus biogenesis/stability protein PilW [Rhodanobacteraceae bacterium]|nr:type IV pilus biogenesis/stability protein PilW [Rhodanobacteraceae bacterium]
MLHDLLRPMILAGALLLVAGCASDSPRMALPTPTRGGISDAPRPQETEAQQRQDAARVHTQLGQQYMQRGQLERALEKLQTALRFDPGYVPAQTVIAVLYDRIGKLALAEQHYRQAVKLAPDKGSVNNNLGAFLCRIGKADESIGYFKKAVSDPFYATPAAAYVNAGACLMKLHRAKEAEAQLDRALALDPGNAEALFQMADAMVAQKDYFHARAFIQRFDALGKPNPAALLLGYRIESQLGDRTEAQQYLKTLRDQFPDSEQARSLIGEAKS